MRLAREGGPMPLVIPAQQEVARETATPLFPKNWASHLLKGGMLGSCNRKKGVQKGLKVGAKRKRREKPAKIEQRKV